MDPNGSVGNRTRRRTDAYLVSLLPGRSPSGAGGGSSHGQTGSEKKRGRRRMREEKTSEGEKEDHVSGGEATASAARASSSSSKSKATKRSSCGGLKSRRDVNDDFVCLGEFVDEREYGEQRRDEPFVLPPPKEVIDLVDSDDNDNGNASKEEMNRPEDEGFEDAVDVDVEDKDEEVRGSNASTDKAESSGHGERGWARENPIMIGLDGGSESEEGSCEDSESGSEFYFGSSSDTRDYGESSDEDFLADDNVSEGSSSEDDSSSYDDDDKKEVKERIRKNEYEKKKSSGPRAKKNSLSDEGNSSAMDRERNVETESSAICNKNGDSSASLKKKCKQGEEEELEDTPSSALNDERGEQDQELWENADCDSVSSGSRERQMKGCSTKLHEVKGKKVAKKSGAKRVERTGENGGADVEVFGDSQKRFRRSKPFEDEVGKDKEKQSSWRDRQGVAMEKERGDSAKIVERMENENERVENKESEKEREATREHKGWVNSKNHEKKAWVDSKTVCRDWERNAHRKPLRPKEVHLIELLAECFGHSPIRDGSDRLQEKDDDVPQRDTRPPVCVEALPLKFTWGVKKDVPVEKTESEKERDMLWDQMDRLLRFGEVDSLVGNVVTTEDGQNGESPATLCKHDFKLDEQIGIHCILCGWMVTHIKDITPPFVEECPNAGSRKRVSSDGVDVAPFDEAQFEASDGGSKAACPHNGGTVWDIIPDIKQSLYAHQQDGFEFLWTNLAGTIDLGTLKTADPTSTGGCIISHAPGTGKTRLTIVFLQTYLEVFPKCRSVIIAPASLLLNWEDEFKKWDIGIPFHNLNSPELSGKEHVAALKKVDWSSNPNKNVEDIRMVKLYSWFKEKSILGISYNLYEKIARDNSKAEKGTRNKNRNEKKEKRHESKNENTAIGVMGKILREIPGLLVLDEGHTPRNQRSLIWKVLSEIQTQKRIILSGTPFQNNFLELYNTLCLVKPSFPDMIPHELKKFCQSRLMQEKKAPEGLTCVPVSSGKTIGKPTDDKIRQLKLLMDPFVHVHKGSILQKNLPGLRDCVVTLMPDNMQKALLESIECSQNTLKFDHKLALVSAHPSLLLSCSLTEKEESFVDGDNLERLRSNPYAGVKTRFLVEFVRLCEALNEKVLVFSQFIDPLCLIRDQLKSVFKWSEGKELLYMSGKLDKKQRQLLIHGFNDAKSQAKVLLASTKACSEGINLVGASRVVLLDVVWNPSVERQAISRAYRLGQKRVVYTYHLITHGTSEYEKFCKQVKKDRLSELVFSARHNEDDKPKSSAAVFEDEVLDKMLQHDKLKDMFGDCVVQPKDRYLSEIYGS